MTTQNNLLIFLPVESTSRELDYKLNIARYFCNAGFDVIIGNPAFVRDELKFKNFQGVFLEKGLNPDPHYYQMLCEKKIYVYDLGDEGAIEPVYNINYEPTLNSLKHVKKIFLWGNNQKEHLIKLNSDKNIHQKYLVTGNPGYDLCLPKYKPFNNKLNPNKFLNSYILINTNFGCKNSYSLEEQLKACSLISPETKQCIIESYEKEDKQWSIFQEWLEDIIQHFPNEQFIIRPHPTEIKKNYENIFNKYQNVLVSKEGNVNYVTSSAKLVLHKDCTTAMQAYLMEVPSISIGGEELYTEYVQWPLHFSYLPKNLEEAKDLINQIINNYIIDSNLQNALNEKAMHVLDGNFSNLGNSTQILVNTILDDINQLKQGFIPYKIVDNRSMLQKVKMFVRKRLPLNYKVPKLVRETLVKFTKEDILKRLALLESLESIGASYKAKRIFPNTYRIYKK